METTDINIKNLEQEFNQTLAKYNTALNLYTKEELQQIADKEELLPYTNKNVKNEKGDYGFVNNYGYYKTYSVGAWKNRSKSCLTDAINVPADKETSLMKNQSLPMNEQQACGVAGHNIKKNGYNIYAWVDIQGNKHLYSDNEWNTRKGPCLTKAPVVISAREFDNIPTGSPMTSEMVCSSELNKIHSLTQVNTLYDKLVGISDKIKQLYDTSNTPHGMTTSVMHNLKKNERKKINHTGHEIQKYHKKIKHMDNKRDTTLGQYTTSELYKTSAKYHFFAWGLTLLVLVLLIIKISISNNTGFIFNNIILIISFAIVFSAAYWIYKRVI